MAQAIVARGLTHRYGERVALDGFEVEVPEWAVFGLLGPNGSGKSTFLALLAAMERPQSGELLVFSETPSPGMRARVGTVFQENAQDPLMSVAETLVLAGRLFSISRGESARRARELLGKVGLAERGNDRVATLSGGMRRRLEVARALMHRPELLLLDEPTTGVDPGERRALWESLVTARANGAAVRTVLLASNDLAEADAVCDIVAFVDRGRVVASGSPADLKRGLRRESVRVSWPGMGDADLDRVRAISGAGEPTKDGHVLHVTVDDSADFVPRLFGVAGGRIRSVRIGLATLEDAYFQYVKARPGERDGVSA